MYSYRVAGLAVASEIELPGMIDHPAGGASPEVIVRSGAVPEALEGASEIRPTFQIAGELFLLRIPGVARFLLRAGREMTFEPQDGTPASEIAIFISGTVFGILLHQRGQMVLHASAIRVTDKAVLFCGASGSGKSTIAAALGQRGYSMLSDDVCAITIGAGQVPMAQPDGRQLKLWEQAIDELDLGARRGVAVRGRLEKYYVEPLAGIEEALPLGAVYILRETRPPRRDGVERLNIVDAAMQIRRNAYRPRLVKAMKQDTQYLEYGASIANKAGVFGLNRPHDFAIMPSVLDWLEAHWRETGLLGAKA